MGARIGDAMHFLSRSAALAIAFSFLSLAAMPLAAADMARPTWTVGDFWQYQMSGESFIGIDGDGTFRVEVVAVDTVSVGAVNHETYRTRLSINITDGSLTVNIPGEAWFRTSDLSLVRLSVTVSFLGQTITFTVTYDPPSDLRWPFVAGQTWSSTSLVTTQISNQSPTTITETLQFTVQATQSLTVPAGTFETTPLREISAGGESIITYWSPQVGNSVRQQNFDDASVEEGRMELASYRYQNPGGFTAMLLLLALAAVIGIAVVAFLLRRRRPQAPMGVPPGQPWASQPPSEPAQPPGSPPQGPPGSSP